MAGESVLIIEDDPELVEFLLTNVLSPRGYLAQVATSGQAGLSSAREKRPDLVLLDLGLNDLPYPELLEQLQVVGDPPVILLTPADAKIETSNAFRLGARDVLTHPLHAEETTRVITRVISQERLAKERDLLVRTLAGSNAGLERSLARAQALYQFGKMICSSLDPQDVFTAVLDAAISITQAEMGYLLLLDQESDELVLCASRNLGEARTVCRSVRIEDNIARQVLRAGEPIALTSNGQATIKVGHKALLGDNDYLVRALINVPLFNQQYKQIFGVLGVGVGSSKRSFEQDDLLSLTALADSATIAIDNAQLHSRTQQALSRALTEVSAERHRNNLILQLISEGIYTVDQELRITSVNQAVERITGWEKTELLGRRYDKAFVPQINGADLPAEQTVPGLALQTQSPVPPSRRTILCKDKRRISVTGTAIPLYAVNASASGVLATMCEVSSEMEVSQLRRQLVEMLQSESFALDKLTDETLRVLHLEAGTAEAQQFPITLKPIITQVVRNFEKTVTGISFEVTLAPNLPFAIGNASKTELALVNLIDNVLLQNDSEQTIRISGYSSGEDIVVAVEGTSLTKLGNGLATDSDPNPSTTDQNVLSGNDLSRWATPHVRFFIASKMIQSQGGRIWTENQAGAGMRFHFSLPKIEVQDVAETLSD